MLSRSADTETADRVPVSRCAGRNAKPLIGKRKRAYPVNPLVGKADRGVPGAGGRDFAASRWVRGAIGVAVATSPNKKFSNNTRTCLFMRGNRKRKTLTPREITFIGEILAGQSNRQAAIAAGTPSTNASQWATKALARPQVAAALEKQRGKFMDKVSATAVHTLEQASKAFDDAIEFAIKTENASAYVRAVEMRAKLHGHMVDKHDVRVGHFEINISGIHNSTPALDVDFTEVLK